MVARVALALLLLALTAGIPLDDDDGGRRGRRVSDPGPAPVRIEFNLANITTGGSAAIESPTFTVPANSCVVAAIASVWANPVPALVVLPIFIPSYGPDDTPDFTIVDASGIPEPSLLAENIYVWQWNAAAGFANRSVRVDFEEGDIPEKMVLYVFYLTNIETPFKDYPNTDPISPLSGGVGDATDPRDSDESESPPGLPDEAGEISVAIHYTNGPVGDAAGAWHDGFVSGGRGGTTGGAAGTNATIDCAWRHPAQSTAFNVEKSGFTSRGFLLFNRVFKSVTPP